MSDNKELIEVLSKLNVTMGRVDRGNFLSFMRTQQMAERSTPTNAAFGTAIVGSVAIQWLQILQRNDRRKYVEFVTQSAASFYMFANNDQFDANELAKAFVSNVVNGTDVVLGNASVYAASPNPIRIETSGAIYVASFGITDSLPSVAQGHLNWQEAIFSDLDAIPGFMPEHRAKAGDVASLTTGELEFLGTDVSAPYARGGVR